MTFDKGELSRFYLRADVAYKALKANLKEYKILQQEPPSLLIEAIELIERLKESYGGKE